MGWTQSLEADVCQFTLLLPQFCAQVCYNLIITCLTPFRESGDNEIMGKLSLWYCSRDQRNDRKITILHSSVFTSTRSLYLFILWFNSLFDINRTMIKILVWYLEDDAEAEDFIDTGGLSPSWWILGEEGAEDSGVAISSMSAYGPVGFEPFLLKALLNELRNCWENTWNWDVINNKPGKKTRIKAKDSWKEILKKWLWWPESSQNVVFFKQKVGKYKFPNKKKLVKC